MLLGTLATSDLRSALESKRVIWAGEEAIARSQGYCKIRLVRIFNATDLEIIFEGRILKYKNIIKTNLDLTMFTQTKD